MVIFSLGVETFSVLLNVPQESKITDLVSALPAGYRLQLTGKVSFDPHSLACTQLPPRRSTPPHQSTPDKFAAHQPSTSSEEVKALVEATTGQPDSESFSPIALPAFRESKRTRLNAIIEAKR